MAIEQKCDQCGEKGLLGPDIRAYSFATPSGKKNVVRFLHASDGGRDCYARYHARYRAFMDERRSGAGGGTEESVGRGAKGGNVESASEHDAGIDGAGVDGA